MNKSLNRFSQSIPLGGPRGHCATKVTCNLLIDIIERQGAYTTLSKMLTFSSKFVLSFFSIKSCSSAQPHKPVSYIVLCLLCALTSNRCAACRKSHDNICDTCKSSELLKCLNTHTLTQRDKVEVSDGNVSKWDMFSPQQSTRPI